VQGVDLASVDEAQQQFGAHPGHLLERLAHRGQPRGDDLAELQVVEAHHGQVAGDPQAPLGGRVQGADGDLVVEGDDRRRRLGQGEQVAGGRPAVRDGGLAARADQAFGREPAGGGQRGAVPEQAVFGGDPVVRAGDGGDPGVPEPEQVLGGQPGAGQMGRRDRGDAGRQGGALVHDHERVAARVQVGQHIAGLGREDEQRPLGELRVEQPGQAGLVAFQGLDAEHEHLLPLAQGAGDRGQDRAEVLVQHVGAADRDDPGQRRAAAASSQPVPLDGRQHGGAGRRGHGGAAVEHPGHGRGGHPGLPRDVDDGGPLRRGLISIHQQVRAALRLKLA
jgi:hypothetical protein